MTQYEDSVAAKIQQRAEHGLRKYGVSVERTDLRDLDWLRHAQEEAMDLTVYLERLLDPWLPIDTAPTDGKWFVAKSKAELGDAVYPCAFDSSMGLWVGLVDFTMVSGLEPEQWKPLV